MLPPTIVLVIFGFALNPKVRDLRLGVVDESSHVESRDFVDSLTRERELQRETRLYAHARGGRCAQESGPGFVSCHSDRFRAQPGTRPRRPTVQVVIDAVDANTAQIAQGYLEMALEDYNSGDSTLLVAESRRRSTLIGACASGATAGRR